jgi:uncharacterized protein (DUF1330 family)
MAGPGHFQRYVLIEFPTSNVRSPASESPDYQDASVFRKAGGEVETASSRG